jgi:hypothetical protein
VSTKVLYLLPVLALSGCGGTQQVVFPAADAPVAVAPVAKNFRVSPVAKFEGKEVCIIENPRVRKGFLEAYRNALANKGYEVRLLPASAQLSACLITSQYMALWGFDTFASYLRLADIKVYNKSNPAGRAVYRGNLFINAEETVQELVNRLFPD